MRFSVIIPVYNVEKYIPQCLQSLEQQTFKDFEAILVNDGTKDNSQNIIDEFVQRDSNHFKSFIKENGGLSDARNYGITKSNGEYLIFLDSDDYLDNDFFEKIDRKIKEAKNPDLVRVPKKIIYINTGKVEKTENFDCKSMNGQDAFVFLREKRICIETAWSYCVNTKFWQENQFQFSKGKLHEDFGTMLVVLLTAKKVAFMHDSYYNYLVRENSIMTDKNNEKILKMVYDKLDYYDKIIIELENMEFLNNNAKECCLEYISTAVIMSINQLKGNKKEYKKELKKRNVLKNIKTDNLRNYLRKLVFIIMMYI